MWKSVFQFQQHEIEKKVEFKWNRVIVISFSRVYTSLNLKLITKYTDTIKCNEFVSSYHIDIILKLSN